jgi:phosphoglycerol geranylgeranyltransferase
LINNNILLTKTSHTKLIILIDPDKYNQELVRLANECNVYCIFVGGSVLINNTLERTIKSIKALTTIPVIIFPGDETQISKYADGLLILSLLSGRNADYLIGKHVKVASKIIQSKLKTISTGYILVDGGKKSTTQKVTKSKPLNNKKEIINTAIAGELLGKQLIYLEAGSGAKQTLNNSVIKAVKQNISIPLIVGGGIDSESKVKKILLSNPDYIVIGNAFEKNPNLLTRIKPFF